MQVKSKRQSSQKLRQSHKRIHDTHSHAHMRSCMARRAIDFTVLGGVAYKRIPESKGSPALVRCCSTVNPKQRIELILNRALATRDERDSSEMVFKTPTLKFYNGNEIPSLGLGTWKASLSFSPLSPLSLSALADILRFPISFTRADALPKFAKRDNRATCK